MILTYLPASAVLPSMMMACPYDQVLRFSQVAPANAKKRSIFAMDVAPTLSGPRDGETVLVQLTIRPTTNSHPRPQVALPSSLFHQIGVDICHPPMTHAWLPELSLPIMDG